MTKRFTQWINRSAYAIGAVLCVVFFIGTSADAAARTTAATSHGTAIVQVQQVQHAAAVSSSIQTQQTTSARSPYSCRTSVSSLTSSKVRYLAIGRLPANRYTRTVYVWYENPKLKPLKYSFTGNTSPLYKAPSWKYVWSVGISIKLPTTTVYCSSMHPNAAP